MLSQYLLLLEASIFQVLASLHLYYTFFSHKFLARKQDVDKAMQETASVISKETTTWKAWVGFNGSHSLGAIFFGLINILPAWNCYSIVQHSYSITLLDIVACFFYLLQAKRYWFKVSFVGILVATCCFAFSSVLNILSCI